jgi:hypothetical protein
MPFAKVTSAVLKLPAGVVAAVAVEELPPDPAGMVLMSWSGEPQAVRVRTPTSAPADTRIRALRRIDTPSGRCDDPLTAGATDRLHEVSPPQLRMGDATCAR